MKVLRWITSIVFVAVLGLYVAFSWTERKNRDDTFPVIDLPGQELQLSIHAPREQLLDGVTAYDEKDGDLTDRLRIESVSKFVEPGLCKVTYAVVDGDNHVAKATRTMRYTDYVPPRFFLKIPMFFYEDDDVNIREQIGAMDCIDGDISDRVTVLSTQKVSPSSDSFIMSVQVTNSHGDKAYLDIPVYMAKSTERGAEITLTQPMIYAEQGSTPDFAAYIGQVTVDGVPVEAYTTRITSNFKSDQPGVYAVQIMVTDAAGNEGRTVLTVVVEEN